MTARAALVPRDGSDLIVYGAGVTSSTTATRIILARHYEASYVNRSEGDGAGGTLTEIGRSQAHALAVRLSEEGVAAVYCSALSRATQTAAIVAESLNAPVNVQPALREYELGDEPYDSGQLAATLLGWLNGTMSGTVLSGESGHQVARRMFTVVDEIVREHSGRTVLVVSHGGAILATLGSIAPGRTGLPTGAADQLSEHDLPGGTSFNITHRHDGWLLS